MVKNLFEIVKNYTCLRCNYSMCTINYSSLIQMDPILVWCALYGVRWFRRPKILHTYLKRANLISLSSVYRDAQKSHYTVSSHAFVGLLRLGVPGKRENVCLKV